MKQTAVEWLEEQYEKAFTLKVNNVMTSIIEQAKQMEKEQSERMYSEEEVLDILRKSHSIEKTSKMDSWITKWFKQFKKK